MTCPTREVWTQLRRELWEWFAEVAPSLCPAYEACVTLLADPSFPGRHHFISHGARDIISVLPQVIVGGDRSERFEYKERMQAIGKCWPTGDLVEENVEDDTVTIPAHVYRTVDAFVSDHGNHPTQRERSETLMRHLTGMVAPEDKVHLVRLANRLLGAFRWFQARAHVPAKQVAPPDETELKRHFEDLEILLHSFKGSFFTGTDELDEILQRANQTRD